MSGNSKVTWSTERLCSSGTSGYSSGTSDDSVIPLDQDEDEDEDERLINGEFERIQAEKAIEFANAIEAIESAKPPPYPPPQNKLYIGNREFQGHSELVAALRNKIMYILYNS